VTEPLVQLRPASLNEAVSQIREAAAARKCWPCGCLHNSLRAIEEEFPQDRRPEVLDEAMQAAGEQLTATKYDCLGCKVCFPAVALNALKIEDEACPVEPLEERAGWPPLPGDYKVIRYNGPVAVCALNSDSLVKSLAESKPDGLAVAGTMYTENLGIERVIRNTLANPHVRFLVLCGEDTQQAVGHLPGQSFECLFRNGLDERGRIIGARGKRPFLKNVSGEEVQAFVQQVELVPMIGEESPAAIAGQIRSCAGRNPGSYPRPAKAVPIQQVQAREPQRLTLDKAGYFVVYPDARSKRLMVEHYTNQGVLNCVLEGSSPAALYSEAIERQLVTRLDHAAYLGQELARAEHALGTGEAFIQDRAPGEIESAGAMHTGCGCAPGTCKENVDE